MAGRRMADGSAGAAAAMADGSADGPAADATGRKAELRAKLDTLYSQMAALEVEALGLDHIPELAPGAGADSPSAGSRRRSGSRSRSAIISMRSESKLE